MIRGLHHASITTADVDRLKHFYIDLFGFECVLETSWTGENPVADAIFGLRDTAVRMVMLKTDNAFLELFKFANPVGAPGKPLRPVCDAGITHVCICVDDVELEYDRLIKAGMKFNCPPQAIPGLCSATYGRDPDGNIIEVMQVDPDGPFAVGGS